MQFGPEGRHGLWIATVGLGGGGVATVGAGVLAMGAAYFWVGFLLIVVGALMVLAATAWGLFSRITTGGIGALPVFLQASTGGDPTADGCGVTMRRVSRWPDLFAAAQASQNNTDCTD
jgi:hypothetical protein